MMEELKEWVKELIFAFSIFGVLVAGCFLIFIIWSRIASAEPILEQIHYFYEDDRYFARLLWTPELQDNLNISLKDLGVAKVEIGIWLN